MSQVKVTIKRICGCVLKNDLEDEQIFENRELAIQYANEFIRLMDANSCHTHKFFYEEKEEEIVISSTLNTDLFSLR